MKIINTKPAVSPSALLILQIEGDEMRQMRQGHQQGQGLRVATGQSEQDAATSASPPLPNLGHRGRDSSWELQPWLS